MNIAIREELLCLVPQLFINVCLYLLVERESILLSVLFLYNPYCLMIIRSPCCNRRTFATVIMNFVIRCVSMLPVGSILCHL